jgi:hypothetical protein
MFCISWAPVRTILEEINYKIPIVKLVSLEIQKFMNEVL